MPEGIHDNTTDADREAIEASRERRKKVATDAAAEKAKRTADRQKGTTDKTTTKG